tara:strand:- start:33 stop:149 length:117 start_codon:yes stop_codon:yes gene_type:complete
MNLDKKLKYVNEKARRKFKEIEKKFTEQKEKEKNENNR